jgi:hypothetical protein
MVTAETVSKRSRPRHLVGQKDAWFMAMMGRESVREPLYIWEDDVRPDRDLAHSPLCEACYIEQ